MRKLRALLGREKRREEKMKIKVEFLIGPSNIFESLALASYCLLTKLAIPID